VRTVRYVTAAADLHRPGADQLAVGEDRLRRQVETDLQLANTTASQQVMYAAAEAEGYRRVIHPELSQDGRGTCGLCIVASDRIYSRQELLPLHAGCHCGVLPIIGGRDHGQTINRGDLSKLYAAAGSTRAEQLRETRVRVDEHGELGPVLSYADQAAPRDRRDVQLANSRPTEEQRRRSLETQRQTLRGQLAAGGLTAPQTSWLSDRLDVVEKQLLAAA
jgi:hypothetical protein